MDPVYAAKAKKAFRFFDLNKDGIVTRDELARCADIILSLGPASKFDKDRTRDQYTKWADAMFPEGHADEKKFCEENYKLYINERESYEFQNRETCRNLFRRLDANGDGYISEMELGNYYKAFGYDDAHFVKEIFTALDTNKDGLISEEEYIEANIKYWTSEPVYEFLYNTPATKMD